MRREQRSYKINNSNIIVSLIETMTFHSLWVFFFESVQTAKKQFYLFEQMVMKSGLIS